MIEGEKGGGREVVSDDKGMKIKRCLKIVLKT